MPSPVERQPELANAVFVTDQLAVGGDFDSFDEAHAAEQVAEMVGLGMTHVLDVRLEWSDETLLRRLAPDVRYRHDGIDDAGQQVPGEWFDGITAWATDALADPAAKLLVHCHMGINRAPSSAFAVLLAQGWDLVDALDAIRDVRPIAYIAYADDVLRWHHDRTHADRERRSADLERLERWRHDHDLDVVSVIRRIRTQGG